MKMNVQALPSPLRSAARQVHRFGDVLLARWKALPDFIIVGAQKAGTTSLFHYLNRNKWLRMSSIKEVHYYDLEYARGQLWYRSHFPLRSEVGAGMRVGEASPYYIIHPHAPRRIHQDRPDARLIFLLRNPTQRAISHYHHELKHRSETLPMLEAFEREEERIAGEWKRLVEDETYSSPVHRSFSYKQRGVYADQIERFLPYFDRDQMLIMDSERLFSDSEGALREVCSFLGVGADFEGLDLTPRNVGAYEKKYPEEIVRYLDDYFAPHNARLSELLGREVGW